MREKTKDRGHKKVAASSILYQEARAERPRALARLTSSTLKYLNYFLDKKGDLVCIYF
jgi:hypothetical protein